MKKIVLTVVLAACVSAGFAQQPKKSMKELRDSIYTVMNLSEDKKQMLNNLIAEQSATNKAIMNDANLTGEEKKTKSLALSRNVTQTLQKELTAEQLATWKQFNTDVRNRFAKK